MALARGTPAGSLSTSKLIASAGSATALPTPPEVLLTPATPAPGCGLMIASSHRDVCRRSRQRPHSFVGVGAIAHKPADAEGPGRQDRAGRAARSCRDPAGAGVAGGEADGMLG